MSTGAKIRLLDIAQNRSEVNQLFLTLVQESKCPNVPILTELVSECSF